MKKIIAFIAVIGIAANMMPLFLARADGFGITPPYVSNDQLTQNSRYETTIMLVRSDPTEDLQAKIAINVPGADNWISIDRGTQFILPAGTQQEPIVVSVNVPGNARLGNYAGNIQVVVSPVAGPAKGTVGITIGAQIDVNLKVVDGRMAKLSVHRVTMTNTEEESAFLWMHFPGKILLNMDISNAGNIPGSPKKVVFQYQNYLTGDTIDTEQNTNGISSVLPFDTKTVTAEMPAYLPQGSYRVLYQIFDASGATVIGQGTLDLAVLPQGTLPGYQGYDFWGIRWSEKLMTFGIVLGIAILLYGLFIGLRSLARRWLPRSGRGVPLPPRR
jgi:hypothetical protein